ncbi:hypothetical protein DSCW_63190 [Desulfosarcina widdelii]|uniref:Uncharacterized protein n=1 Tax=Desulfosarcina widdelii TaxID=947919 RepID=A0A5K7ZA46_9BACT|nr:hypothetical protein [Desulfosarcina widdelii]BBO78902.1 hypothetical protein DSCW_63190 [Desulfosarcina widdelii]
MESVWKPNYLIGFYFSILLVLLLCVSTTPLLIRHGIAITDRFIIEEEVLETIMILVLFGVSFLVMIRMINRLNSFRQTAERAVYEKSRLISRLAEAFRYIGRVNVEIQEIESALCGVAFYPQSKKEFRALVDKLALKAMTIAAAPWLVVRMIDRNSGQTVNEHAVQHPGTTPTSATMGNRAILNGVRIEGLQTIGPRQQNLDLLTVMIFPAAALSKEKNILLSAILNQIEMLFILYRAGCIKPSQSSRNSTKEVVHDTNY